MAFDWQAGLMHPLTRLGAGLMMGSDPRMQGTYGFGYGLQQAQQGIQEQQRYQAEQERAAQLADLQMRLMQAKLGAQQAERERSEGIAGVVGSPEYAGADVTARQQMLAPFMPEAIAKMGLESEPDATQKGVVVNGRIVNPFTGEMLYESPDSGVLQEDFKADFAARNQIEKANADYREVANRANQIMAAVDNPGPFSDVTLVNNIAKFLDPGSVVRPSETEALNEAGGLVNDIQSKLQQAAGEGRITETVRKDIRGMMNRLLSIYENEYETRRGERMEFLGRYGKESVAPGPIEFPQFSAPQTQQKVVDFNDLPSENRTPVLPPMMNMP